MSGDVRIAPPALHQVQQLGDQPLFLGAVATKENAGQPTLYSDLLREAPVMGHPRTCGAPLQRLSGQKVVSSPVKGAKQL